MRNYLDMLWTERFTSLDWWVGKLIDYTVFAIAVSVWGRLVYGAWPWNV